MAKLYNYERIFIKIEVRIGEGYPSNMIFPPSPTIDLIFLFWMIMYYLILLHGEPFNANIDANSDPFATLWIFDTLVGDFPQAGQKIR